MEKVISNGQESKRHILESVKSARNEIKIAMAYFTDKDIAEALQEGALRGVKTTVILGDDPTNDLVKSILIPHCKVYTHTVNGRGIMHYKFCLIDESRLIYGTYNYTYNAAINNKESLHISDSKELISKYSEMFIELLVTHESIQPIELGNSTPFFHKETNYLDNFTEKLQKQILLIFDDFDAKEIEEEGKKLSEDTTGNKQVFTNYLDSLLNKVKHKFSKDDHSKTIIKTKMAATLDAAIETNTQNLEGELSQLHEFFEKKISLSNSQIQDSSNLFNEKKEELNQENGEVKKVQLEIEDISQKILDLDKYIFVRPFWVFPTYLKLFLTILLFIYLSLFFGSAIWKIFFEESEIFRLLSLGITPAPPPLFDADALYNIFSERGGSYGLIATIFFIIPVLLTSVKLLAPANKVVEVLVGWIIGIFAIDIVVSILISQHSFEINNLLVGGTNEWSWKSALGSGEFWLIFIFGALPLLLTKLLIQNIWVAYNNSDPDFVDREKSFELKGLKRKKIDMELVLQNLNTKVETLKTDLERIGLRIQQLKAEKNEIESQENEKRNFLIEQANSKKQKIKEVYNTFIASIDSGNNLFFENAIRGRISAFKQGFYFYLTDIYSPKESGRRIGELEESYIEWKLKNFNN